MSRLPTIGGDSGSWGNVLNDYLLAGHDSSGHNVGGKISERAASSGFTLAASDEGTRIVATASLTVTLPTIGVLGNGFECEVVNDSGSTVTIDGPGATNVSMSDGDIANILETNGKQRVVKGTSTVVS